MKRNAIYLKRFVVNKSKELLHRRKDYFLPVLQWLRHLKIRKNIIWCCRQSIVFNIELWLTSKSNQRQGHSCIPVKAKAIANSKHCNFVDEISKWKSLFGVRQRKKNRKPVVFDRRKFFKCFLFVIWKPWAWIFFKVSNFYSINVEIFGFGSKVNLIFQVDKHNLYKN